MSETLIDLELVRKQAEGEAHRILLPDQRKQLPEIPFTLEQIARFQAYAERSYMGTRYAGRVLWWIQSNVTVREFLSRVDDSVTVEELERVRKFSDEPTSGKWVLWAPKFAHAPDGFFSWSEREEILEFCAKDMGTEPRHLQIGTRQEIGYLLLLHFLRTKESFPAGFGLICTESFRLTSGRVLIDFSDAKMSFGVWDDLQGQAPVWVGITPYVLP